jgi:anaerobic selenocysteine-containing dehydrogenase
MDQFESIGWDEAIADLAGKILENQSVFGKDSTGCILGGDIALEDAYVACKLFKGALGFTTLDTVESLHSRSTDRVLLDQLGEVASPTCLNDIGLADLIVVIGEDLATTHPVVYAHVAEAVANKGADLVVIDPRYTATSQRIRSLHVPVKAGGEVALLNAIGAVLVHEMEASPSQWTLDHALNGAAFAEFLKLYSPLYDENERVDADYLVDLCDGPSDWVAPLGNRDVAGFLKSFDVPTITGIDTSTVRDLARRWNQAGRVLTIWSSRLAGTGDNGIAISTALNIHLLTGQMGRPGAGPLGLQAYATGRGAMDAGASPITIPGALEGGVGAPPAALVEVWGEEFADQAAQLPQGMGLIDMLGRAKAGELPVLMLLGGSVSMQLPDMTNLVHPALTMAHVVVTAGPLHKLGEEGGPLALFLD